MFKTLWEKKRQLDNLISVAKWIKNLKSHYRDEFIDVVVNSDFHIETIMIFGRNDWNAIIHWINACLDDMKYQINQETQEILNSKH